MSPMMLKAMAISPPPPMPCMARKAISSGMFWLRPHRAEPIEEDHDGGLEDQPAAVEVGDLAPERCGRRSKSAGRR